MTYRPVGSVWEFQDGSHWKVKGHTRDGSGLPGNFGVCVKPSKDVWLGCMLYSNIEDRYWTLVSTPTNQSFTDEEYEELLV